MNSTAPFLNDIERLNEWLGPQALRRYQIDWLEDDSGSVISPFDGKPQPLQACYLIASNQIAYQFDGGRFYLLVGPQQWGYPLRYLIDAEAGRLLEIRPLASGGLFEPQSSPWPVEDLLSTVQGLRERAPVNQRTHALFGDGNFAHLLWNGWPALAALPDQSLSLNKVRFVSRCDPMGDAAQLFPWLRALDVTAWDDRTDLHAGAAFQRAVFLGASYLSASLASQVRSYCERQADQDIKRDLDRLADQARCVIWLSLRRRARDCPNTVDFLSALIPHLLDHPSVGILIDGFSMPDCRVPDVFHDYRRGVDKDFSSLLRRCPQLPGLIDIGRAIYLNGRSIHDAITAASVANAYICHGGTQQHKIGWLHAVPGVVHLPNPRASVSKWYALQSEVALAPACMPASAIEIDPDPALPEAQRSYRLRVDEAVAFTLRELAPILA